MKNIAVVLAGCGVMDGSEIYESTLTILALDRLGVNIQCTAPDIQQYHVINHLTNQAIENETRNVLLESARLARSKITPLHELDVDSLDAAIFPGGFGAAKNSCSYAYMGEDYDVDPQIADLIQKLHAAGKPLGFLCIAPMIVAKVLGNKKVKVTIGNDPETAKALESHGAKHVDCNLDDIVVDEPLKIVSTPAFMLAPSISKLEPGINKLVQKVIDLS